VTLLRQRVSVSQVTLDALFGESKRTAYLSCKGKTTVVAVQVILGHGKTFGGFPNIQQSVSGLGGWWRD